MVCLKSGCFRDPWAAVGAGWEDFFTWLFVTMLLVAYDLCSVIQNRISLFVRSISMGIPAIFNCHLPGQFPHRIKMMIHGTLLLLGTVRYIFYRIEWIDGRLEWDRSVGRAVPCSGYILPEECFPVKYFLVFMANFFPHNKFSGQAPPWDSPKHTIFPIAPKKG